MAISAFDSRLLEAFLRACGVETDLSTVSEVRFTFNWDEMPRIEVDHVAFNADLHELEESTELYVHAAKQDALHG